MSLDWNVSKIKNKDEVCFIERDDPVEGKGRYMRGVTEALIWATMLLGIPQITEKNYLEVYKRNLKLGKVGINFLNQWKDDDTLIKRVFTLEEIKQHIGLSTNASTRTNAAFNKNLLRILDEEIDRKIQRELKEEENASIS